jgi:purine-binding chemotaxis protein CheW
LPKAPEIVLGVINWQGKIVPVVDVRKRFRLPEREMEPDDRFILAHTARRQVALAADAVAGIRELTDQELVSAAQAIPFAEYLGGVAKIDGDLVLIHDLERFLSLDEEQTLDVALAGAKK